MIHTELYVTEVNVYTLYYIVQCISILKTTIYMYYTYVYVKYKWIIFYFFYWFFLILCFYLPWSEYAIFHRNKMENFWSTYELSRIKWIKHKFTIEGLLWSDQFTMHRTLLVSLFWWFLFMSLIFLFVVFISFHFILHFLFLFLSSITVNRLNY